MNIDVPHTFAVDCTICCYFEIVSLYVINQRIMNATYDTMELRASIRDWNVKAAMALSPSVRAACLNEALRCAQLIQRSLQTPVLNEGSKGK